MFGDTYRGIFRDVFRGKLRERLRGKLNGRFCGISRRKSSRLCDIGLQLFRVVSGLAILVVRILASASSACNCFE